MSNEEDTFAESEEEEPDFSASEDKWLPTKNAKKKGSKQSKDESSSDEDNDDEYVSENSSNLEDFEETANKKKGKPTASRKRPALKSSPKQATQAGNKRKRLSPGLRDRLYQQYKKDLLKEIAPVMAPLNSSVSDILQKCQYQRKSTVGSQSRADDSDSSGDDHLVDPKKLDLRSTFFNKNHSQASGEAGPPQFDVNAGMRLSDSSDGEEGESGAIGEENLPASIPKRVADKLISHINQQSGEFMNFQNLDQFTAKMEEAKMFLKNYQQKEPAPGKTETSGDKAAPTSNEQKENVSCLLAQGETDVGVSSRKAQSNDSSESDWEEVQTGDGKEEKIENEEQPKDVTIEMDTAQSRRKRREELEMELYIKRQINKVKRANQLNYHKSSVLCAVAIGQQLNRIIGDGRLRGLLISIMQDKTTATKQKWDEKKVQSLADWFKMEFTLQSNEFWAPRTVSSLRFTLSLSLYTRKVSCRRNYILLFLACLRSAGCQARIVLSANVPSKRPAMQDLCPMSERKIKENLEKRLTSGVPDGQTLVNEHKRKSTVDNVEQESSKSIVKVPEVAERKEIPASISRTKENPSEEPLKIAPQKVVTRKSARKALATLNIPQLDGGDDELLATTNVIPLRRSLRSKSAAAAPLASPGLSPFTKRKSNTPGAKKVVAPKSQTIATRKRKLFPVETESKNPVPTAAIRRTAERSTSGKLATYRKLRNKTVGTEEQTGIIKTTPAVPLLDDDAFESKQSKAKTAVKIKVTSAPGGENAKEKNIFGKNPVVVLTDVQKTSIARKVLSPSSSLEDGGHNEKIKETKEGNSKKARVTRTTKVSVVKKQPGSDDSADDSDFELPKESSNRKKKSSAAARTKKSPSVRRCKTRERQTVSDKTDIWIEFYCEKSKRWITYDLASGRADCVDHIVRNATNPISYVFSWDNGGFLKDVTARYVQNWNTACRMLRVEQPWLDKVLVSLVGAKTDRDLLEDKELNKLDGDKPLPKTIGELKNHPLYALKRHLLKFEALYPAEPPTLGFIREEAIYPRECVYTLQTREKWYKQGRVVRPFESAYKVVRCWKYDRPSNNWLKDQPCDIFGLWQTDEYDPPTAENGIVPRNEYGNVELFIDKMLPKRTVHLKLPGLNKVCKRLQIDCAPALTGFDMAKMRVVPVYEGFVICEEFAEQAVEEWYKEMEQEERREQEKMEKRVYGNWKRLIKGLLVRRRLQNKYNFDNLA